MARGKRHNAPSARRKKKFVGSSPHSGIKPFFPWRRGRHDCGTYAVPTVATPTT